MRRHTVARDVEVAGVGLHSGVESRVHLRPAPLGHGLVFVVDGVAVPADLAHAAPVPGATMLRGGGATVGTPEHLLAACRGLGIADLRIELQGAEVPALDGAARAWVDHLRAAGLDAHGSWDRLALPPGRMSRHGGEVELRPLGSGESPTVTVDVDFPDGPHGRATWDGTAVGFVADVAWARTFVLADQVEPLRAAGRGRGADASNTLVVARRRAHGADDAAAREAVAHKLLDAIGDLALLPPLAAHVVVRRGSHRVVVDGLRALLSRRGQSLP